MAAVSRGISMIFLRGAAEFFQLAEFGKIFRRKLWALVMGATHSLVSGGR